MSESNPEQPPGEAIFEPVEFDEAQHEPSFRQGELAGIALDNLSSYPTDSGRSRIQPAGVYTNHLLRELGGGLLDVDEPIHRVRALITRSDSGQTVSRDASFMQVDGDVIPLGTHVSEAPAFAYAVQETEGKRSIIKQPLDEWIMQRLPEQVTLTRVLSEDEAAKYEAGSEELGSSSRYWQEKVHTSLHNVTNEFQGDEHYQKVVKFIFGKEELAGLVESGSARFGTYEFLFANRDPNSPLPFDAELTFSKEAVPTLMRAYRMWSEQAGTSSIDSPS